MPPSLSMRIATWLTRPLLGRRVHDFDAVRAEYPERDEPQPRPVPRTLRWRHEVEGTSSP